MKKIMFLYLFIYASICTRAQEIDTVKLNDYFQILHKSHKAMVSVALFNDGQPTYDQATGYVDFEKKINANIYTQYRIGSITKMFTAVMILQLVDEKKLKLNSLLKEYYPTIKNADKITIKHLLSHRSGLFNYTSDSNYSTYNTRYNSDSEMLVRIEKFPLLFEPGKQYEYSNTNYYILALILEKITKLSYSENVLKRICAKAKMGDTRIGAEINTDNNEAASYNFYEKNPQKVEQTHMSVSKGAGNLVSTTRDLSVFIHALFEGALISKSMLDSMLILQDKYGLGITKFPFDGKWFWGHTGGIDGFQSILAYNKEDKLSMCILGNAYQMKMNDIAIALLSAYYNKPYEMPMIYDEITTENEAKLLVGSYQNMDLPMKINISYHQNKLYAQAETQQAFVLSKKADLHYVFEAAGIELFFKKNVQNEIKEILLKQIGMEYLFIKR